MSAAIVITLLLSVNFNDEIVGKHSHIAYITSVFSAVILILVGRYCTTDGNNQFMVLIILLQTYP